MCHHVMVEVDLLRERLPTLDTEERPLSGVDTEVTFQIAFLGEPFPTKGAPVWFLSRVDDVVNPQGRRVCEGLPAQLARLADSLSENQRHAVVCLEPAPLRKMLLTNVAKVGLVGPHVVR